MQLATAAVHEVLTFPLFTLPIQTVLFYKWYVCIDSVTRLINAYKRRYHGCNSPVHKDATKDSYLTTNGTEEAKW